MIVYVAEVCMIASRVLTTVCLCLQTELSQLLQALSEKAKSGTEFIHRLKCMAEHVQVSVC